jgi:hypothetical protein
LKKVFHIGDRPGVGVEGCCVKSIGLRCEEPSVRFWLNLETVAIVGDHVRKLKFFGAVVICDKLESSENR